MSSSKAKRRQSAGGKPSPATDTPPQTQAAETTPPADEADTPQIDTPAPNRAVAIATAWYLGTVAFTVAAMSWALQLWRADLRVPFSYEGDATLMALPIKTMIDNGWFETNRYLAAPFGFKLYDYPFVEPGHLVIMKVISLFARDWAVTMNLYYLLTYPLTAVIALYVLRRLGVSWAWASAASILYAMLPYHLLRGEFHLYLSGYYAVPLVILSTFWLFDKPPFFDRRDDRLVFSVRRKDTVIAIASCVLLAFTSYYYTFFAVILALIAGVSATAVRSDWRRLVSAVCLVGVLTAGVLASMTPNLIYWAGHGKNPHVGARASLEAFRFGLEPVLMLLPTPGHRIAALANLRANYEGGLVTLFHGLDNENGSAALGTVGTIGFFVLLFVLATSLARPPTTRGRILSIAAQQSAFAYIIGTTGGIGAIIAMVWPQFRCYNRIAIFIAFFSLLAVVSYADRFTEKRSVWLAAALALVLVVLGVLDQTSPYNVPDYAANKAKYTAEADFTTHAQAVLPPGSEVLEFPFVSFPEADEVGTMDNYEEFRPYLHSTDLKWSFGDMHGSPEAYEMSAVCTSGLQPMVAKARELGFSGLFVDTAGFPKNTPVTQSLAMVLGPPAVRTRDGRMLLWVLH